MRILVLEDEPLVAQSLMTTLRQLEPDCTLIGPVPTVREALQTLGEGQPDLVIADIQLSDGISLDVFVQGGIGCPVIFTTAFNEYAIRAFKLNSIDYLLKPVDREELAAALRKFHLLQSKFSDTGYVRQMMELFADFRSARRYKDRFAVHLGRSVTLVPLEELAYFEKEEIIYLVNREGKRFITDYRSLDEVEELVDPGIFFRANRQYLVQLSSIESYRSDDTGKIALRISNRKGEEVVVSKERAAAFRKWFG